MARPRSALPWVLRVVWIALPFTAGPALGSALHDTSASVRGLTSVGLWAGWAGGVTATLVPHPLGLTALRVLAPAAFAAAFAAAVSRGWNAGSALAITWTALATAWVFAPMTGAWSVNGPAYPNERRFPLRAPGPLVAGLLPLAWGLTVGGIVAGPLLLAARQWVWGALATAIGLPVAVALLRALHGLARRWAVFVPAGLVLHDPLSLVDAVLVRRETVEVLRAAPAGSDSLDLTQGALGLALELVLREPVDLTLVRPGHRTGEAGRTARLLFTPTRPGALLDEARARRLRVG